MAVLLVGGCGSAKTASKSNATTASTGASTPAPSQSTGATQAHRTSKAHQPVTNATSPRKEKAPEAKPESKEAAAEAREYRRRTRERETKERAAAKPGLEFAEAQLPKSRRYPKELQGKFMLACKAAKGSTSSCECIVAKQELKRNIEVGQGLAELLALELAFERKHASLADVRRHRVPSPVGVRRVARECR